MSSELIEKYNKPGPRYTSYPPVPNWQESFKNKNLWTNEVRSSFRATNSENGISIYIHLPFCESLCTYCGCTTRITVNHDVETPYVDSVLKEWQMYRELFDETPIISELHLGGGTPTFFSPDNLKRLVQGILDGSKVRPNPEFSFEGHPKNTTGDHLQVLHDLGFARLSLGIQDFDPKVQKTIHRVQTHSEVKKVVTQARTTGYQSINFDLVYGLPKQNAQSILLTMDHLKDLKPDRIALYSYAHVPWIKPAQKAFEKEDLPNGKDKKELFELAKSQLRKMNYEEIGMDHFALKSDDLYHALGGKRLNRNFMGYTTSRSTLCIGLGASSISDTGYAYAQNKKSVEAYQKSIQLNALPIFKGHLLSEQELLSRKHITRLMCNLETSITAEEKLTDWFGLISDGLHELTQDGLIGINGDTISVTNKGRIFVRNICMALDIHMMKNEQNINVYSKVI